MTTHVHVTERLAADSLHADAALNQLLGTGRSATVASARDIEQLRDATLATLRELAADPVLGPRLALAATTVEVHIIDAPDPTCFSLLLDRAPVEPVDGSYPEAEVKLYLTAGDLAAFWIGELHVAIAITDGRIGYQGPVRKTLRILPLVRRYAESFTAHRHNAEGVTTRDSGRSEEW
jgi:hypothetical protein